MSTLQQKKGDQKNLAQQLVHSGALSVSSQDKFTPQEQAELYRARIEWEMDREAFMQKRKEERKQFRKFGLFSQIPGGVILGGTLLGLATGKGVVDAEAIAGFVFGTIGVVAPWAISGVSWLVDRIKSNRYLKSRLKDKEKEILMSREKSMRKELSDVVNKKLADAQKEHAEFLKNVPSNTDKKLPAQKRKNLPTKRGIRKDNKNLSM